jgi:1-acyl-sn-glycerol-3-phosphate acyltransferase
LGGKRGIEVLWFTSVLHLIGLRVRARGAAASGLPVLFAANHVSYLDIMVLGQLLDARFIAKSDVRSWPGIGFLARISGTCFIRRVATEAAAQNDELAGMLGAGRSLILFAEGTSSDGASVLPFKSSLFGVVDRADGIAVQPVAIRYTHLNGMPVSDAAARDRLSWYGEMTLMPHLWTFLGQKGGEVEVHFLDVERNPRETGRKTVARMAENAVRKAVQIP